ncbi:protein CutA [Melopsittacus undulatus]|uniref:protein CutA n=1 Tax=Melopsittacus undulatus TaxID=13146 RepID=UPI00146D9DE7|nr:protein CutA [Melopsittacus undulatus]
MTSREGRGLSVTRAAGAGRGRGQPGHVGAAAERRVRRRDGTAPALPHMKLALGALALVSVTLTLQGLGRRLLSMASSPPRDPPRDPPADPYDPGSVSAAFVTCPNETVAKELARAMVEQKLAACVNVLPHVTSIYTWKGKLEEDNEVLLMIKTRSSRIPALTQFIRSMHPYEVAEVVAVPVAQGNPPYLQWVQESVPP